MWKHIKHSSVCQRVTFQGQKNITSLRNSSKAQLFSNKWLWTFTNLRTKTTLLELCNLTASYKKDWDTNWLDNPFILGKQNFNM